MSRTSPQLMAGGVFSIGSCGIGRCILVKLPRGPSSSFLAVTIGQSKEHGYRKPKGSSLGFNRTSTKRMAHCTYSRNMLGINPAHSYTSGERDMTCIHTCMHAPATHPCNCKATTCAYAHACPRASVRLLHTNNLPRQKCILPVATRTRIIRETWKRFTTVGLLGCSAVPPNSRRFRNSACPSPLAYDSNRDATNPCKCLKSSSLHASTQREVLETAIRGPALHDSVPSFSAAVTYPLCLMQHHALRTYISYLRFRVPLQSRHAAQHPEIGPVHGFYL